MSEIISLTEAVDEIMRTRTDGSEREPFFFIVGAGVSAPSVKTASALISDFVEKYEQDKTRFALPEASPPSSDQIDLYSFWFQKAYPQPFLRRNFLKQQMAGKPPSAAVLRLAHLLTSGRLCSLVVTPNFDDLLQQALGLFGRSSITCDHPATATRVDLDNATDIQVVHVHGTYNFYDLCNLRAEVSQRSTSGPELATMAFLLNRILSERSPIVVGYAGWDHDVIMTAIRESLRLQPASHLYWFCHTRGSYDILPDWLKGSDHVRFILPNMPKAINEANQDLAHEDAELEFEPNTEPVNSSVLSAVEVFDALNRRFQIEEPLITRDPFEYLAKRLEPIYQYAEGHVGAFETPDSYDFSSVVRRLRHAAERDISERQETESSLEQIRAALRRSSYKRACTIALNSAAKFVSVAEGSGEQILRQFVSLFARAVKHAALDAGDAAIASLVRTAMRLAEMSGTESDKEPAAIAVLTCASAVTRAGQHARAILLINQVLSLLQTHEGVENAALWFNALMGKAVNLLELDSKDTEGFEILDQVIDAKSDQLGPRITADAYLYKARFMEGVDNQGALGAYETLINRYRDIPALRSEWLQAVRGAARVCNRLKEYERTISFTKMGDRLLSTATNVAERVAIKQLSISQGVALQRLGRTDDAVASFEIFANLDETERAVAADLPQVNAMQMLAGLYEKRGEIKKAHDVLSAAIARFSETNNKHALLHIEQCRNTLERISARKSAG